MKTQTSLVAQQVRLQQWAEQVKDCQSRPAGMKVDAWCNQNGISKANYYYRLRRVRETCLASQNNETSFVELPVPQTTNVQPIVIPDTATVAILRGPNDLSVEITSNASPEIICSLIGALAYAK